MTEINDLIEISKSLVLKKALLNPYIKNEAIQLIEIDEQLNNIFKLINNLTEEQKFEFQKALENF
jgi:hypothetical protein